MRTQATRMDAQEAAVLTDGRRMTHVKGTYGLCGPPFALRYLAALVKPKYVMLSILGIRATAIHQVARALYFRLFRRVHPEPSCLLRPFRGT
jgi:hypothetical protein